MQDLQDEPEHAAGRRRRPKRGAEHWRGVIDQLDASGLSVADFCAAEGVPAPSVYHWRRKLRDDAVTKADASPPRLVRLEPTASVAVPRGLAVAELAGGDRVSVGASVSSRAPAAEVFRSSRPASSYR